jgi:hypothetical protein
MPPTPTPMMTPVRAGSPSGSGQRGVAHGHLGGGERVLHEEIGALDLLPVEPLLGTKSAPRRRSGPAGRSRRSA